MPDHLSSIETNHYTLRYLQPRDLSFFLSLYQDRELMSLVGRFEDKAALTRSFNTSIKLNKTAKPKRLTYCIYHENVRIGISSLIWKVDQMDSCEIGTIISPKSLKTGVAHEIMQRLINIALIDLSCDRVFANFRSVNKAALNLVKKLGFQLRTENEDWVYCFIEHPIVVNHNKDKE